MITTPAPHSEQELLDRARGIAGLTLAELAARLGCAVPRSPVRAKGWFGQLVERALGATAASLPEPDFQYLGVELKTLPLNRQRRPKESTYVCTVPLAENSGLTWHTSLVYAKLKRVLWLPVEGDRDIPLEARRIGTPLLWSPDSEQEEVLRQDWEELMDMVVLGQLDQIGARHGTYLQIRPKAANGRALCRTSDSQGDAAWTLPRGFYLRSQFTAQILSRHFVLGH